MKKSIFAIVLVLSLAACASTSVNPQAAYPENGSTWTQSSKPGASEPVAKGWIRY